MTKMAKYLEEKIQAKRGPYSDAATSRSDTALPCWWVGGLIAPLNLFD